MNLFYCRKGKNVYLFYRIIGMIYVYDYQLLHETEICIGVMILLHSETISLCILEDKQ